MINIINVNFKTVSNDGVKGVFELEPLVKGFGYSLGSSLRRTLYSSTRGAAITKVSISGVRHQFSTIKGVKDDVLQLILNLKLLKIKKVIDEPVELEIDFSGKGAVTGKDVIVTDGVEIVNKDFVITNLADASSKLKAKLTVESGYGYVQADENATTSVGEILLDASYSPIVNVITSVNPTRVGSETNFDKLTITVETDGTVDPEDALREAASVLKEFFYRIESGQDYKAEEDARMAAAVSSVKSVQQQVVSDDGSVSSEVAADEIALEELRFPTRTINALKKSGIKTLADLAAKPEDELLKIRNLGEKSIREILALLEEEGLR